MALPSRTYVKELWPCCGRRAFESPEPFHSTTQESERCRRRIRQLAGSVHLQQLRSLVALRDQTGAAIAAGVDPQPIQRDGQAIAHADQEVDVGEPPDPPSDPATYSDPSKIDYGGALADGRETAGMLVAKRSR